jgi:hypothetical protein
MLKITYKDTEGKHVAYVIGSKPVKGGETDYQGPLQAWVLNHPYVTVLDAERTEIVVENSPGVVAQPDIRALLGIDIKKLWGLFDGKSSSLNGKQMVMGLKPKQHLDFLAVDMKSGELSIDYALDGDTIAVVYQDTEKFQQWTPTAALIASCPVLLETLREIADGKLPYDPRVLANAALAYMERIIEDGKAD